MNFVMPVYCSYLGGECVRELCDVFERGCCPVLSHFKAELAELDDECLKLICAGRLLAKAGTCK